MQNLKLSSPFQYRSHTRLLGGLKYIQLAEKNWTWPSIVGKPKPLGSQTQDSALELK